MSNHPPLSGPIRPGPSRSPTALPKPDHGDDPRRYKVSPHSDAARQTLDLRRPEGTGRNAMPSVGCTWGLRGATRDRSCRSSGNGPGSSSALADGEPRRRTVETSPSRYHLVAPEPSLSDPYVRRRTQRSSSAWHEPKGGLS